MNLRKLQEIMKKREAWCTAVHGVARSRTRLRLNNKWPNLTMIRSECCARGKRREAHSGPPTGEFCWAVKAQFAQSHHPGPPSAA